MLIFLNKKLKIPNFVCKIKFQMFWWPSRKWLFMNYCIYRHSNTNKINFTEAPSSPNNLLAIFIVVLQVAGKLFCEFDALVKFILLVLFVIIWFPDIYISSATLCQNSNIFSINFLFYFPCIVNSRRYCIGPGRSPRIFWNVVAAIQFSCIWIIRME